MAAATSSADTSARVVDAAPEIFADVLRAQWRWVRGERSELQISPPHATGSHGGAIDAPRGETRTRKARARGPRPIGSNAGDGLAADRDGAEEDVDGLACRRWEESCGESQRGHPDATKALHHALPLLPEMASMKPKVGK